MMNQKIGLLIFILLFILSHELICQENQQKKDSIEIKFHLSGKHIAHTNDALGQVMLPEALNIRRPDEPDLQQKWELFGNDLTDNPIRHGASYIKLTAEADYHGISAITSIFAEHRGASYGTLTLKDIVLYPKFYFAFDTSFNVFNEKFSLGVSIGNYDNINLYEGLNMYNIDVQGDNWYFKWRNLKFEYNKIADLLLGIGLNMDDANDFIFSLENLEFAYNFFLTLKYGFYSYNAFIVPLDDKNNDGNTFSAGISYKDFIRLYMQYGKRNNDNTGYSSGESSAFLLGLNVKYTDNIFNVFAKSEYRSYGKFYNLYYYNQNIYYRDTSRRTYSNNVGPELYPLYYYDRKFSQWAVFTEYQGMDVICLTLQFDSKIYLIDRFYLYANLDINSITAGSYEPFTYSFIDYGAGYEVMKDNFLAIGITNKAMNLDNSYPTFYQYANSVIKMELGVSF
ncbi:MAG: hypothetical protein EPN82_14760 [Bacteroidetes bacterium]|nr:MAG: hypothetical protein EPN82_14760 [Bacteroidota bacterium]